MDFIKINRKTVKAPTSISVSIESLDKAERTMDGTMVIDTIGEKRRVDVSWDYLTKEEMVLISTELKSSTFVSVSFYDNTTGEIVTITARTEGLKYSPAYDWVHSKVMWKSISVSFIER